MSAVLLLALAQSAPAAPVQPEECRSLEGEIVVCGSRKANERYRLRPIADAPAEQAPPTAELAIGEGKTIMAGVESGPKYAPDVPRFMITFKMKF